MQRTDEVSLEKAEEVIHTVTDAHELRCAQAFLLPYILEDTLMQGLVKMENNPAWVRSITGWPWIISVNLNAN